MLIIGHTAIGVGVGLATGNPLIALGAGVVSHHLGDAVPHFDPGSYLVGQPREARGVEKMLRRDWIIIAVDTLLTLGYLVYLYPYLSTEILPAVAMGVVGANLPDIIHNVPFWSLRLRRINWVRAWQEKIHWVFHWTLPVKFWYIGVATQLVPIVGVAWWVVTR